MVVTGRTVQLSMIARRSSMELIPAPAKASRSCRTRASLIGKSAGPSGVLRAEQRCQECCRSRCFLVDFAGLQVCHAPANSAQSMNVFPRRYGRHEASVD